MFMALILKLYTMVLIWQMFNNSDPLQRNEILNSNNFSRVLIAETFSTIKENYISLIPIFLVYNYISIIYFLD